MSSPEAREPEAVRKLRELTQLFEELRRAPPPIKTAKPETKTGERT